MPGDVYSFEWGKVSAKQWQLQYPEEKPDANAIIIFDDGQVKLSPGSLFIGGILTRHKRLKILTNAGINEAGNQRINFYEGSKLLSFSAQTLTPGGEVYELKEDDYYIKEFEDYRILEFAFPKVDSGCIIEYKYSIMDRGLFYNYSWYFHNSLYTYLSRIELSIGEGLDFSYSTTNIPDNLTSPTLKTEPGARGDVYHRYIWTLYQLDPIKDVPYITCPGDYQATIKFILKSLDTDMYTYERYDNWRDMGKGFLNYLDNNYIIKFSDLKKQLGVLSVDTTSRYDHLTKIYNYVRDDFRTDKTIHNMDLRNKNLKKFYKEKIGSAFEKNILLREFLLLAGYDAELVFLCTRSKTRLHPKRYTIMQFDYGLVQAIIENDTLYLDANSQYINFGNVPSYCRVDSVLFVHKEDSHIGSINFNDPETKWVDTTHINVMNNNTLKCITSSRLTGYFAGEIGELYEVSELSEFMDKMFYSRVSNIQKDDQPDICRADTNGLNIAFSYNLPDAVKKLDVFYSVNPFDFRYNRNPFVEKYRFVPIDFNFPAELRNVLIFKFDDSIFLEKIPNDTSINYSGLTFSRSFRQYGNEYIFESNFTIDKPYYSDSEYINIQEFFDQMILLKNEPIVYRRD